MGKTLVILGSSWGDEGKGKFVDYYAQKADIISRVAGGSNAGHTLSIDNVEYKLRLVPSGILCKDKLCVIGNESFA